MKRLKTSEIVVVRRAILEKRQDFKCPLCKITLNVAGSCLDHDHATGLVRGVLCRNCNGIEGKIRNLVTRARRGADHSVYLSALQKYWEIYSTDRTGLLHPTHLDVAEKRIKTLARAKKLRAKRKVAVKT